MSKFNLKNYKKTNGDEHINMRLEESRSEAPDVINEKQLEDYRVGEEDVTIEKLLEKNREGAADEITERRLDTHKAKFANKYRNPDAFSGDINKLEEKRLSDDPVEKEKYEPASQAPKQMRWWEGVKSEDGLKLASVEDYIKTAQTSAGDIQKEIENKEGFGLNVPEEMSPDEIAPEKDPVDGEDFKINVMDEDDTAGGGTGEMEIVKEKLLPNPNPDLNAVYIVLSYNQGDFQGDEAAIKTVALSTIFDAYPELSEAVSASDLSVEDEEGIVRLRAVGPEFEEIIGTLLKKK